MRTRNVRKEFKLSEEEAERLKEIAQRAKVPEAVIIRSMIMGYRLCEKPGKEFYEVVNNLGKIGTNINQIAARVNASGRIDVNLLQENIRKIMELRKQLQEKFLLPKKGGENGYL